MLPSYNTMYTLSRVDIKKVYTYDEGMKLEKVKKLDTRRSILVEKELHEQMMQTAKATDTSLVGLIRHLFETYGRNIQS
jgi:hypothetical protein